jgi:transposase-like protein
VVLGVTTEGYKEILSITVGANESSKFWLGMLNDLKKFASDFKAVYNAPNEKAGLEALSDVREKWGKKYPYAVSNWEDVSPFFQFPDAVRRIMYTTNIIEGLNRQYRKVTKTKSVFPSDSSLEKMLYLASLNVAKKWTQRYRNWDQVLNQLTVLYGERLTQYL